MPRLALRKTGILFLAFVVAFTLVQDQTKGPSPHSRHLLQVEDPTTEDPLDDPTTPNSTSREIEIEAPDPLFPKDLFTDYELSHGAVVLHIIGIMYMFYALALVCDEFFVPSLDVISEKLGISPDVAGATFMAAGGSAPELFTSIIGVFIAKSDVGIGTIVGSAVFNILFVIAACAFAAKEALSLTAWPLVRDVFFYSIALLLLVIFFLDNEIQWWEALILFLWYGAYVGFMKFNEPVEDKARSILGLDPAERDSNRRGNFLRNPANRKGLFHLMNETINPGILKKNPRQPPQAGEELKPLKHEGIMIGDQVGITQLKTQLQDGENGANNPSAPDNPEPEVNEKLNWPPDGIGAPVPEEPEEEGEAPIDMSFPVNGGWKKIVLYLISFPIMAPLFITLCDTRNQKRRKFYVWTFFGSILWIAVYSYLMVWWATVAGKIIGIPDQVMGLTFLAAGTSVPDLITSVLVAKQGKGDMAVSSSVGSNIFDVTVGLPVPWLLYCMINGGFIGVNSEGVGCSVSLLFLMLIFVFLAILIFKWKMTKGMGILMMVLYVLFVIICLGFSYDWYKCPI